MKIIEFKNKSTETMKELLVKINKLDFENIDGLVVLILNKDGTQEILSSNMNMLEKSFLLQTFQSWVNNWFKFND